MNIYAIGDLHLGFSCNKPMHIFGECWKDHVLQIETYWKQEISSDDIILIPGDISWALRYEEAEKDLAWLNGLPGHKICIRGNHDYWWDRPGKLNQRYSHITFLQNDAYLIGKLGICGTRGWECFSKEENACEDLEKQRMITREILRLKLSLNQALKKGAEEIWVMLHYPPTSMSETESIFTELMQAYPVTKVIYGHLHDKVSWEIALQGNHDNIYYALVSADYLGFNPYYIGKGSRRAT